MTFYAPSTGQESQPAPPHPLTPSHHHPDSGHSEVAGDGDGDGEGVEGMTASELEQAMASIGVYT